MKTDNQIAFEKMIAPLTEREFCAQIDKAFREAVLTCKFDRNKLQQKSDPAAKRLFRQK